MLKRMTAAVLIAFTLALVFSCSSVYLRPQPGLGVCSQPVAVGSVICAIATSLDTSPEQMNDMLLDATLVPIMAKITTSEKLRAAVTKVQQYVNEEKILTINGIIRYITERAELSPELAMLLSRRLTRLQVPTLDVQTLTPFDITLVSMHLAYQQDQLFFLWPEKSTQKPN